MAQHTTATTRGRSTCRPDFRRRGSRHCQVLPIDDPKRPDLEIYSQLSRLNLGQNTSWESPDIKTNHWDPWTLYTEIPVTVRNISPSTRAINAEAELMVGPHGIGFDFNTVGIQRFHLNGASETELSFPLPQSVLGGPNLISTRVILRHPFDGNKDNNIGEQCISGSTTSQAGRAQSLVVPIRNSATQTRTIDFTLPSNQIAATLAISQKQFAPGEQYDLVVDFTVPDSMHGAAGNHITQHVTVLARSGVEILGGATHILRVDD